MKSAKHHFPVIKLKDLSNSNEKGTKDAFC